MPEYNPISTLDETQKLKDIRDGVLPQSKENVAFVREFMSRPEVKKMSAYKKFDNLQKSRSDIESGLMEQQNKLESIYTPESVDQSSVRDATTTPIYKQEGDIRFDKEAQKASQIEDLAREEVMSAIKQSKDDLSKVNEQISTLGKENVKQFDFKSRLSEEIGSKIGEWTNALNEALNSREKSASYIQGGFGELPMNTLSIYDQEETKNVNDLRDVRDLYKKMQKVIESPSGKNTEDQLRGLMYGLTQTNTAKDFFSLGVNQMRRDLNAANAFDKYAKAREEATKTFDYDPEGDKIEQEKAIDELAMQSLEEGEAALLETYKMFLEIQGSSDANFMTGIGAGLQEMLPFIAQYSIAGGGTAVVKQFIKSKIKNAALGKVAGGLGGVLARTALMPGELGRGVGERVAPKLNTEGILEAGDDKGSAILGSFANLALENAGEAVGDMYQGISRAKKGTKVADKVKFNSRLADNPELASRVLSNPKFKSKLRENPSIAKKFINGVTDKFAQGTSVPSVQALPFELIGEEFTGVTQAILNNDESIFTAEAQGQLLVTVLMASSSADAMSIPKRVATRKRYESSAKDMSTIKDQDYAEAINNAVNTINDPVRVLTMVDALGGHYGISTEDAKIAKTYAANSIAFTEMNTARKAQMNKELANFKDNKGGITTTVIGEDKFYIKNIEDLGVPGKVIYVKDKDGNVESYPSENITEYSNMTNDQVNDAIDQESKLQEDANIAQEQANEAAQEKGINLGQTVNTSAGRGTVQSINPDQTINIQSKNGDITTVPMAESEVYKTAEQKAQEKEDAKLVEDAKNQEKQAKSVQIDESLATYGLEETVQGIDNAINALDEQKAEATPDQERVISETQLWLNSEKARITEAHKTNLEAKAKEAEQNVSTDTEPTQKNDRETEQTVSKKTNEVLPLSEMEGDLVEFQGKKGLLLKDYDGVYVLRSKGVDYVVSNIDAKIDDVRSIKKAITPKFNPNGTVTIRGKEYTVRTDESGAVSSIVDNDGNVVGNENWLIKVEIARNELDQETIEKKETDLGISKDESIEIESILNKNMTPTIASLLENGMSESTKDYDFLITKLWGEGAITQLEQLNTPYALAQADAIYELLNILENEYSGETKETSTKQGDEVQGLSAYQVKREQYERISQTNPAELDIDASVALFFINGGKIKSKVAIKDLGLKPDSREWSSILSKMNNTEGLTPDKIIERAVEAYPEELQEEIKAGIDKNPTEYVLSVLSEHGHDLRGFVINQIDNLDSTLEAKEQAEIKSLEEKAKELEMYGISPEMAGDMVMEVKAPKKSEAADEANVPRESIENQEDGPIAPAPKGEAPFRTAKQKKVANELVQAINDISEDVGLSVVMVTEKNMDAMPPELRSAYEARARRVGSIKGLKGVYYKEKVYIFPKAATSVKDIEETYLHEVVGHYGLRNLLGKRFDSVIDKIYDSIPAEDIARIERIEGTKDRGVIADEYLAGIAESAEKPSWWSSFISSIRELFRKRFDIEYSQKDIEAMLQQSRDAIGRDQIRDNSGEMRAKSAYHGSPHSFDKFSTDAMGTGEGAQAFGWGLYFTDKKGIAEGYADMSYFGKEEDIDDLFGGDNDYLLYHSASKGMKFDTSDEALASYLSTHPAQRDILNNGGEFLSEDEYREYLSNVDKAKSEYDKRKNEVDKFVKQRNLYKVKIHGDKTIEELNFMRWDKPITREQINAIVDSDVLYDALGDELSHQLEYDSREEMKEALEEAEIKGKWIDHYLRKSGLTPKEASMALLEAGIDGNQYPTEILKKGTHEDSFNYVVFDENAVEIEEQVRFRAEPAEQIDSKQFKEWFGNSEVVNEDGSPKVVYHGTNSIFNKFDSRKQQTTAHGYGFYFATEKEVAKGYERGDDGRILEAYLAIEKPLDDNAPNFEVEELEQVLNEMLDLELEEYADEMESWQDSYLSNMVDTYSMDREDAISEVANSIFDYNETANDQIAELSNIVGNRQTTQQAVKNTLGYDGIYVKDFQETDGDVYIAWFPNQVKSATENSGEFSANNDDIRFRVAESQEELDDFVKDSEVKETVYHSTNVEFDTFDVDKSADGALWFSTDKASTIDKQQSGGDATRTISAKVNIKKPAGWDEYENKSIGELINDGYDGAILDNDLIVFEDSQVLIEKTEPRFRVAESQQELDDFVKDSEVKETVYHGTIKAFDDFDMKKSGKNYSEGRDGFFFTDKKRSADNYAFLNSPSDGGATMSVKLDIKNPLTLNSQDYWEAVEKYDRRSATIINDAKEKGHDGIVSKSPSGNMYVAFSNDQILIEPTEGNTPDGDVPRFRTMSDEKKDKYQSITDKITKSVEDAGFKVYNVSRSSTNFGNSWYIKFNDNLNYGSSQVRISDHSVGTNRFLNDNTIAYINYNTPDSDIEETIKYIVDELEKEKTLKAKGKVKADIEKKAREEYHDIAVKKRDELINDGLIISTINRTYQDIETIKEKHPNWTNVMQVAVGGGAYSYHYTRPETQGESAKYASKVPSKEYLNYLLEEDGSDIRFRQTETPEFKEWFGDSKVVDDNGEPMVVYHGTASEFDKFDKKKRNFDASTLGFYFTSAPIYDPSKGHYYGSTASEYANYAKTVSARDGVGENILPVYLSIKNPLKVDSKGWYSAVAALDKQRNDIKTWLKDGDYDGIVVESSDKDNDGNEVLYVAFKPNQIKSATGNDGSFSKESDDIRFRAEESAEDAIKRISDELIASLSSSKFIKGVEQKLESTDNVKNVKYTHTLIKDRIKAIKQGVRLGEKDMDKKIAKLQGEVVAYAKKNAPLDELNKASLNRILEGVRDTRSIEDVEKLFNKVDELTSDVARKKSINAMSRIIKNNRPKVVNGKPQGKLNPDVYEALDKVRSYMQLEGETYDQFLEGVTDDDVETIALLNTFGNLADKSQEELDNALNLLSDMVNQGKAWYKDEHEARKREFKDKRDDYLDIITGGEGPITEQEALIEDKSPKDGLLKSYLSKNQSLEWLMDQISNDKTERTGHGRMQRDVGDLLIKATNAENKGIRELTEEINEIASNIFGKDKKKLAKVFVNNSKIVNDSGVTVITKDGRSTVPLSQNTAYKKWMELQDPTLQGAFEKMGYDEQTIKELEEFILPEVMKWAKWQLETFYPEYHTGVNNAYRKAYYTNLPFNPKYSPIRREVTKTGDSEDSMLNPTQVISGVGNGSLKSRQGNTRALKYVDGDSVLADHISQMEHFKSWVEPMKELRAVFSAGNIQDAIKKYHGNAVRSEINKRINSLASGGVDRSKMSREIDFIRRNFVTSAIGANLTLMPKQLVSVGAYLNEMSLPEYVSGMNEFMSNPKKALEIMNKTELLKNRYRKGWTHEVEAALKDAVPNKLSGVQSNMNELRNSLMFATKLGDRFGIYGGYPVYAKALKYFKKNNPNASDEVAEAYAANEFERIVGRTQQSSEIKDTSSLQEGSVNKLFSMFKNSQQQYMRYEMAAIRNLLKGRGSVKDNLKIIAINHFLLPLAFQAVSNYFSGADEDDKKKRLIRSGILGSLNGLLIAGDILQYGIEKLQGENWGYTASPVFGSVENLGYSMANLRKAIKDSSPEDLQKSADYMAKFISNTVTGLPYDPAFKLYNGIFGDIEGDYKKTNKTFNKMKEDREKGMSPDKLRNKYGNSYVNRGELHGIKKQMSRYQYIYNNGKKAGNKEVMDKAKAHIENLQKKFNESSK